MANPPYVTVKDKALNAGYRGRYNYLKGTYALTVPFMELLFKLAKPQVQDRPAGWVGQITSNSFMKREFGAPLIENFLAHLDMLQVIDTSGAFIPGHGTPTAILIGRNQRPATDTVRAVLGIRGEPGRPDVAADGLVWSAIRDHIHEPGYQDAWVTVADLIRTTLARHPWSLTGGGASELAVTIGSAAAPLGERVVSIGRTTVVGEDDAWVTTRSRSRALAMTASIRELVVGENVRDFTVVRPELIWWPYVDVLKPEWVSPSHAVPAKVLWPARTLLSRRVIFGLTLAERARPWYDHLESYTSKMQTPLSITFAEVATHNHFVLDRGGKVFKQTAPVIKLPDNASEDEHLGLLGLLNSSIACFWLKQNCFNKGRPGAEAAGADEPWEHRYQFNGTTLQDFPLPESLPLERGRLLDVLARRMAQQAPAAVCGAGVPTRGALRQAEAESGCLRGRMIAEQEELDWETYRLYGIAKEDLTYSGDEVPELAPGERAFAIALARRVAGGQEETSWFSHWNHQFTPITEIPEHWPVAYREVVQRRLDLIASDRFVRLLEKPEYKRRWAAEPWTVRQERAIREWLLDRLEDRAYWFDRQGRPTTHSINQLADRVARDADLVSVIALWEGRPDVPLVDSLTRLLIDEAVPYLAAYRLKESGMRQREAWEETWALQRQEDAGTLRQAQGSGQAQGTVTIPVPPKYTSADFRKQSWWQARGKLDVPKERFILYPDAGRSTDPTLLLGWAGWDHAQQALALATIISARESEGAADAVLVPLVAGLAELLPWVEQWHSEVDPAYGVSMAAFFREELATRAQQVNHSLDQLRQWRPAAKTRGRKARS